MTHFFIHVFVYHSISSSIGLCCSTMQHLCSSTMINFPFSLCVFSSPHNYSQKTYAELSHARPYRFFFPQFCSFATHSEPASAPSTSLWRLRQCLMTTFNVMTQQGCNEMRSSRSADAYEWLWLRLRPRCDALVAPCLDTRLHN